MLIPETLYSLHAQLKEGVLPTIVNADMNQGGILAAVQADWEVPEEHDLILTNAHFGATSVADNISSVTLGIVVPGAAPWTSPIWQMGYSVATQAEYLNWSGLVWVPATMTLRIAVVFSAGTGFNLGWCSFQGVLVPKIPSFRR